MGPARLSLSARFAGSFAALVVLAAVYGWMQMRLFDLGSLLGDWGSLFGFVGLLCVAILGMALSVWAAGARGALGIFLATVVGLVLASVGWVALYLVVNVVPGASIASDLVMERLPVAVQWCVHYSVLALLGTSAGFLAKRLVRPQNPTENCAT
jgi:hypothetical protein